MNSWPSLLLVILSGCVVAGDQARNCAIGLNGDKALAVVNFDCDKLRCTSIEARAGERLDLEFVVRNVSHKDILLVTAGARSLVTITGMTVTHRDGTSTMEIIPNGTILGAQERLVRLAPCRERRSAYIECVWPVKSTVNIPNQEDVTTVMFSVEFDVSYYSSGSEKPAHCLRTSTLTVSVAK